MSAFLGCATKGAVVEETLAKEAEEKEAAAEEAAPEERAEVAHEPASDEARAGTYWYIIDDLHPAEEAEESPAVLLWAALPVDRPGQEVTILDIQPEPAEILEDEFGGNRVAFWRIDEPEAGASLAFRYDFEVRNSTIEHEIDPDALEPIDTDDPELARYLVSEPWLERSEEITAKALEIVGDETNPYLQATKIYDWILEEVTYDYPAESDRGVTRAFETMTGDCGEFSHIFITMMRSLGVPARSVTAVWYQSGGHAWAEMYLPPHGWVPVDTSGAQLVVNGLKGQMSEEQVLDFMETRGVPTRDPRWLLGNLYPNRLEVFVGTNVVLESSIEGGSRTFSMLQPGGLAAMPRGILLPGMSDQALHSGVFRFGEDSGDEMAARAQVEERTVSTMLERGQFERALPVLERVTERNPKDSLAHFRMGQSLMGLGRFAEAVKAFQSSIDGRGGSLKRTTDTWSMVFMGMAYDALGQREAAVREYERAIETGADYEGSLDTARAFLAEPFSP